MPGMDMNWLYELVLLIPPLLLSLTVHEFAHARTALAFGDPTAKQMGRVTLNPLAHLDVMGTLVLVVTRFIGWAKPVPVNPNNLHPRPLGDIMVSLAGPMSNFLLALLAGFSLRALAAWGGGLDPVIYHAMTMMLLGLLLANVGLCVFNLIPLFPLDGHHIMRELLPRSSQMPYMHWQLKYGRVLLLSVILLPRLLETVAGRSVVDPIGILYKHALLLTVHVIGL